MNEHFVNYVVRALAVHLLRHALAQTDGGQSPRLCAHDVPPSRGNQVLRDLSALAAARVSDDNRHRIAPHGLDDTLLLPENGEIPLVLIHLPSQSGIEHYLKHLIQFLCCFVVDEGVEAESESLNKNRRKPHILLLHRIYNGKSEIVAANPLLNLECEPAHVSYAYFCTAHLDISLDELL